MESKLNTDNSEYLQWNYGQVKTGILGGIRIEGLDRMRVTVKVEYRQQVIRHNLDLYNEASVDRLVRRCAERFLPALVFRKKEHAVAECCAWVMCVSKTPATEPAPTLRGTVGNPNLP